MQHVMVMTSTASIGIMTLFVVDLVDMYFLSLLGEQALAAAIGYAGTILFFTTAFCIGIAIATGALVSKSLGQQDEDRAKRFASSSLTFGVFLSIIISIGVWINIPLFLDWLGATGQAKILAAQYLRIIIPSMPLLCIAMSGGGILRAAGDAKRAMYSTVAGGLVNAVLDPILIFGLSMGIEGAAWASVMARVTVMVVAIKGAYQVHHLIGGISISDFFSSLPDIFKIAVPAVLTNVATPIGNAYVISTMAKYGDGIVAGMSIVGRITPVAFGVIFALSGAVGPIIGQNFGAKNLQRVRSTLNDAMIFCTVVVTCISIILYFIQGLIISGFGASGEAASIISLFCTFIAFSFLFNGFLFIANAAFNNLGYAHYSTIFNFAKATLGTIPFVYVGALLAEGSGVLIGQAIGTVITGVLAIVLCFRLLRRCDQPGEVQAGPKKKPFNLRIPIWPQSETRG